MHVAVLGAGVIGVTSAWYLARAGHTVTVLERQEGPARETSFANGGQISVSHAEPWANPQAIPKILKWLGREDAPLLFRLRADARQWRWALSFLLECLPGRARRNTTQCLNLALYSRACLQALRRDTGLAYDASLRGILQFHTDAAEFEHAVRAAALLRDSGLERLVQSADECVAIEPALAAARSRLQGGIYTPSDEAGDAQRFTTELADLAAKRGVTFRFGTRIEALDAGGDTVRAARLAGGAGGRDSEHFQADAFVVALGSYSPLLLRRLGIRSMVYPVKGYSATIPVGGHLGAPTVSLTDEARKIVITRLGERLRVAGTAELTGYDVGVTRLRADALVTRIFDLFPDAGERTGISTWAGLRPATPSNVPVIGRTRYRNLYQNTGHGTLGWTMACGSGQAIADIVSGRTPDVRFTFAGVR